MTKIGLYKKKKQKQILKHAHKEESWPFDADRGDALCLRLTPKS